MRRALILTTLGAALLAAPATAAASISASLDVGVRLIEQPAAQPWEVDLLLGGALKVSDEVLPATTRLAFRFPRASVNPTATAGTCKAQTGVVGRLGVNVCPANSRLGTGTAHVRAGDETIEAKVSVYRGPGDARRMTIFVKAEAGASLGITVTMRGTLQKISDGSFGYRFDMPVPRIPFGTSAQVRLVDFAIDVGARRGRVPFIQAPRSCPRGGFPFTIVWTVEGGRTVTDRKAIRCVISATD